MECSSIPPWRRRKAGGYLRFCAHPPSAWGYPKDVLLGSSLETCLANPSPLPSASSVKQWSFWRCVWGSLSCWNTALRPSFWREEIMLCCSISQYMLELIFPSMKCNTPTPVALMQPQTMTFPTPMLDCRHDTLIFVLLTWSAATHAWSHQNQNKSWSTLVKVEAVVQWFRMLHAVRGGFSGHGNSIYNPSYLKKIYIYNV